MNDAEDMKRFKAKQLRYKKPIVKDLNLEAIQQQLWDIQEECIYCSERCQIATFKGLNIFWKIW